MFGFISEAFAQDSSGPYALVNKSSGKALDASNDGNNIHSGTILKQATTTGSLFQSWSVQVVSPVVVMPTSFVLSVKGSSCTGINLEWGSVLGATYYNVYRATTSPSSFVKIASNLDSTTYTDNNSVVSGTKYYYEISATNSEGESVTSSPVPSGDCGSNTCSNGAIYPNCTNCETGKSFAAGYCSSKSTSSVGISSFSVGPSTVNKGGSCNLSWVLVGALDASSTCSIYNGNTLVTSFTPSVSTGSYIGSNGVNGITKNIQNETTYRLSCGEKDSTNTLVGVVNKYATCYINQNFQEVNK